MAVDERRSAASAVVDSYVNTYAKRQAASDDGAVFPRDDANALVALLQLELALATPSRSAKQAALEHIRNLADLVGGEGGPASDLMAYVWARGYGHLPLREPPLEQLERAFESHHTVRGTVGIAWRTLFLAQACPLFSFEHRAKAELELERRQRHLGEKADALIKQRRLDAHAPLHEEGRLAYQLAELSRASCSEEPLATARRLIEQVARYQRPDGSFGDPADPSGDSAATAHLAQILLGASAVGNVETRDRLAHYLLANRVNEERSLLRAAAGEEPKFELSPWVPLALSAIAATDPEDI